jgi:hypothetical protein
VQDYGGPATRVCSSNDVSGETVSTKVRLRIRDRINALETTRRIGATAMPDISILVELWQFPGLLGANAAK